MTARQEPGTVPLLIAILTDRPNLPNAACRGLHPLFDAARLPEPGTNITIARLAAERLCRHCPHTTRCPDSLTTRPDRIPTTASSRTRKATA